MDFVRTTLLYLLPLALIAGLWVFVIAKRLNKRLSTLCGHNPRKRSLYWVGFRRKILKSSLVFLGFLFLLISLAGPRWGERVIEVKKKNRDILFLVDVSDSMIVSDIKPSRLDLAKRKVMDFADFAKGARVGIVAFSGVSFVHCPLTDDYQALKSFANLLRPGMIELGGSSISSALDLASSFFEEQPERLDSQAIVVISDGENWSKGFESSVRKLKKLKIPIYTIGVGTKEGGPVPDRNGRGLKRTSQGQLVNSSLDRSVLSKIAKESGGKYFDLQLDDSDLRAIADLSAKQLQQKETEYNQIKIRFERYQWFLSVVLFVGFMLLYTDWYSRIKKGVLP